MPSEDEIISYITDNFIKQIFFTQLAVVKEDELFNNMSSIDSLKLFVVKAFTIHLEFEVMHSNNPRMDYPYVLKQVMELDYLTKNLNIPNLTQWDAANQINASELVSTQRRRVRLTRRSRR